jgi:hypothetical protein
MMADEPWMSISVRAESERVREELRRTPGSGVCPYPGCTVITQKGIEGERRHQEVVHGISCQEGR